MVAKPELNRKLRPALQRAKTDSLAKISTVDEIKKVKDCLKELDGAVGILEDKYNKCPRDSNIQQLLPSHGMVARALRKVHCDITRRLSLKPKLANPWLGEFTVDMPMEVMDCITKFILNRNNFGHEFIETNTQLSCRIYDFRKAKYLFTRKNIDGAKEDWENIIKKRVEREMERCEVIVLVEKPLELKFHKEKEVLTVKFHYGYWNMDGVPQH